MPWTVHAFWLLGEDIRRTTPVVEDDEAAALAVAERICATLRHIPNLTVVVEPVDDETARALRSTTEEPAAAAHVVLDAGAPATLCGLPTEAAAARIALSLAVQYVETVEALCPECRAAPDAARVLAAAGRTIPDSSVTPQALRRRRWWQWRGRRG